MPTASLVPKQWQRRYTALRITMYVLFAALSLFFAYKVFFPTLTFSFNFKTPGSSHNTLLEPRSPERTPRLNGKIEDGGTLIADAGVAGDFSDAAIKITLENKSDSPESMSFSLRRSYRSFLLPVGQPMRGFPDEMIYRVGARYFTLRNGTLFPYVSENAFRTHYPENHAVLQSESFLRRYPVSKEYIGFRTGSLVSFADGVFVIMSPSEMRPIGSADIFLASGYRFENVIKASEEEIGIYKRGRIFLLGAMHPDGTLLLDSDTDTYYLIENGTKRPLEKSSYLDFLLRQTSPIITSSITSEKRADCKLERSFTGRTFTCSVRLDELKPGFGNDFETSIRVTGADIDINTMSVSFDTAIRSQNFFTLLSQIKQRILNRFGYGNQ